MKVLIITLFIVLLDQITKLFVKGIKIVSLGIDIPGMPYQASKSVIGDFFKITFIENPGMAFGLQIGGKLFLSLFTIFATILLIFFLFKNRNEGLLLRLALSFILGGAIGNLIDRVFYGKIYDYAPYFYGKVVDFLHFDFPNFTIFGKTIYSWPIFNVADVFVTIGFLMILFGYKKIFPGEPIDKNEPLVNNQEVQKENILSDSNSLISNHNGLTEDSKIHSEIHPPNNSSPENSDSGKKLD